MDKLLDQFAKMTVEPATDEKEEIEHHEIELPCDIEDYDAAFHVLRDMRHLKSLLVSKAYFNSMDSFSRCIDAIGVCTNLRVLEFAPAVSTPFKVSTPIWLFLNILYNMPKLERLVLPRPIEWPRGEHELLSKMLRHAKKNGVNTNYENFAMIPFTYVIDAAQWSYEITADHLYLPLELMMKQLFIYDSIMHNKRYN